MTLSKYLDYRKWVLSKPYRLPLLKFFYRLLPAFVYVLYPMVLLYLLLFPGRQGKVLRTMATMGTPRHKKIGYMLQNSLGILLPGSVLGLAATVVLWESVMDRLLSRSDGSFSLELDVLSLCAITLAQFAAAMLLVALLAIPMTRQKNLMKR